MGAARPFRQAGENGLRQDSNRDAVDRRQLLIRTGLALTAAGFADLDEVAAAPEADSALDWADVRAQFRVSRSLIHMGGLYLASHPGAVRRAVDRHRRGLDANPVGYLHDHGDRLEADVLRAAGSYLGGRPVDIALTDSTTMGLGLLYGGLPLRPGDEVLTTTHDFYATHEALRLAAARSGASVRRIELYRDPAAATEEEIVRNFARAVGTDDAGRRAHLGALEHGREAADPADRPEHRPAAGAAAVR